MSAPDRFRYATDPFRVDYSPKDATGYLLPHDGVLGQWTEVDPDDLDDDERAYYVPVAPDGWGIGEVAGVAPLAQVIDLEPASTTSSSA